MNMAELLKILHQIDKDTAFLSYTVDHPRLVDIIQYGRQVVPLLRSLLKSYQSSKMDVPAVWYIIHILHAVLNKNPIKSGHEGRLDLIIEDWLNYLDQNPSDDNDDLRKLYEEDKATLGDYFKEEELRILVGKLETSSAKKVRIFTRDLLRREADSISCSFTDKEKLIEYGITPLKLYNAQETMKALVWRCQRRNRPYPEPEAFIEQIRNETLLSESVANVVLDWHRGRNVIGQSNTDTQEKR